MKEDTPLLDIIYANKENLLDRVKDKIREGANPNERTKYFETPLRVASNKGRFDVVKYLFEAGGDPSHLNWTPLFHAVAYGDLKQVKDCVKNGDNLSERDTWDRTPFLVAVQSGDKDKVRYLIEAGANTKDKGRGNKSAIEYAIEMDNAEMLSLLAQKGFDIEEFNPFGYTPLIQAAESGAIKCIRFLLEAGVNIYIKDRAQFSQKTAIAHASTLEIADTLAKAGDDFSQVEDHIRAALLNIGHQNELIASKKEYLAQKHRIYGASNPQKCEFPFWYDMVRCNAGAWKARTHYDDTDSSDDKPIWSYERFGKSITAIGDNEFIEIAGEHEDHYDPDFCIYNEVFHHNNNKLTIYQYPKEDFPPTDFHTATLIDGYIYIIGNLGYPEDRAYGTTPVYRLDISTFKIQKLKTLGECPGWIYNHSASRKTSSLITIQDGEILNKLEGEETHIFNKYDFELNLNTLEWTRHEHLSKSGRLPFFPEEYKQVDNPDGTVLAIEESKKWRLLKIIEIHRIDVRKGESIHFEDESLTAPSDDYFFATAYSISKPFKNFDLLKKATENKSWELERECLVCRTTKLPEYSRYIGFFDITQKERDAFEKWKKLFKNDQAKVI